jgi:DME family drug/metabolite transporter
LAIASRAIVARYHPVQPVAIAFTLSTLLLLPVVAVRGLTVHFPPAGWGLLLYLGLVPTALSYALYLRGLRTITATVSAIVALLEPLISTLLAVALLGERLSPGGALGGTLLLASVAFLYLHLSQG